MRSGAPSHHRRFTSGRTGSAPRPGSSIRLRSFRFGVEKSTLRSLCRARTISSTAHYHGTGARDTGIRAGEVLGRQRRFKEKPVSWRERNVHHNMHGGTENGKRGGANRESGRSRFVERHRNGREGASRSEERRVGKEGRSRW